MRFRNLAILFFICILGIIISALFSVGPIHFDLAHPLVNPKAPAVRIAFSVGFSL